MGGKRTLDSSFIHSLPLFQSRRVLSPRDGRSLVLENLYEHCGKLRDTVGCCRLRRSWARAGVRTEEFQARVRGKIRRLVNWQSGGRAASSGVRGGAGKAITERIVGVRPPRISSPLQPATTAMTSDISSYLLNDAVGLGIWFLFLLPTSRQLTLTERQHHQAHGFRSPSSCETLGARHRALKKS